MELPSRVSLSCRPASCRHANNFYCHLNPQKGCVIHKRRKIEQKPVPTAPLHFDSVCSGTHGLERRPTDLPKEPAGKKVTLPSHSSVVCVEVVFFKTFRIGLHALDLLGARCEHDIICFQCDDYALNFVGRSRRLSFGAECAVNSRRCGNRSRSAG